jgi:hypothetical protein
MNNTSGLDFYKLLGTDQEQDLVFILILVLIPYFVFGRIAQVQIILSKKVIMQYLSQRRLL